MSPSSDNQTSPYRPTPTPIYRQFEHDGGESSYQAVVHGGVVGCAGVIESFEGRVFLEDLVVTGNGSAREIEEGLIACIEGDLRQRGIRELVIEVCGLEELLRSERYRDRIGKDDQGRVVLRLG